MGWIETPKKGLLEVCGGCNRDEECECPELTACGTLRDEYVRGWKEACDTILLSVDPGLFGAVHYIIEEVKKRPGAVDKD